MKAPQSSFRRTVLLSVIVSLAAVVGQAAETPAEKPATQKPAEVHSRPSNGKGGESGTFADARIDVGDKKRAYRLIVPKSVDGKKSVPLVFAFHGLLDSKDTMPWYSQLDKLAEEKGFVLVFPNGRNRCWPIIPMLARQDMEFFDALFARLTSEYNIDLNRVYITGMSNGAYFSHLVASERADKVAAIAPHSGGVGFVAARPPEAKHKYPVLAIHGADDSIVNVDEGRKTRDLYKKWGHVVEYIEVPGLNHFWAHKVDVNHKMWDFFLAHPMR